MLDFHNNIFTTSFTYNIFFYITNFLLYLYIKLIFKLQLKINQSMRPDQELVFLRHDLSRNKITLQLFFIEHCEKYNNK